MEEQKTINDLGEKEGKLLFFGGVYSNLQALTALKNWADGNGFLRENIFCAGDIPGYCAQPVECIELIRKWNIYSIAGNVELQVRNNQKDCGCDFISEGRCDLFSKNWYSYIQSKIDPSSKQWLQTLPHHIQFTYGKNKITIVHGSWFNTAEFIFNSTPWILKQKNLNASNSNIIIGGHCGLPFVNHEQHFTWLNPGVIGMPANDGTNKVWFATAEIKNNLFHSQFHSLEYDFAAAKKLMIENNLPLSYAETLATGIWDNCEILPEEETRLQGKEIVF